MNSAFDGLKPSSTLYINETVNKLWQQGEQVFHMGFGESRFEVSEELRNALQTHASEKSYLAARGLPQLTQAIARYYSSKLGHSFAEHQVIVGPGSKSLIYGLQLVLDADLFLPTPSWVSYAPQATLLGNKFSYIPSRMEDDYRLDIAELDKLVCKSENPTKLLVINSPNNPTGQMLNDTELEALAEYCRANQIWVLSDEIYFQVSHGGVKHTSISKYYPEGTFVLGGLSKHFSIGGWRLGVALLPDTDFGAAVMQKLVVLSSETWSGVTAPIQYAALTAYSMAPNVEQYVTDCCDIHGIRTRFVAKHLSQLGIRCSRIDGAFYIAANFDQFAEPLIKLGVNNSAQLARYLLDTHKIASLPGSDFGLPEQVLTLRLSTSYLDMESSADAKRIFSLYQSGINADGFMSLDNHPVTNAGIQAFANFIQALATNNRAVCA